MTSVIFLPQKILQSPTKSTQKTTAHTERCSGMSRAILPVKQYLIVYNFSPNGCWCHIGAMCILTFNQMRLTLGYVYSTYIHIQWNLSNLNTIGLDYNVLNSEVSSFQRLLSIYTNVAFGTDESVLFREVSLIQGVLIERFHCR